ncbi:hypothetical protein CERSUDRAFT_116095 [Gelatoporia subvermispora B]|uniref:Superoxide dismutase copper/zinc binding domain-containing protein n=1 Tax=Ceriporiopsis subvermispora (strain B) TaxID=914234 RepID=M2QE11_CERS8|nr:hypothetical protein CERSUDRAFT_116095 [Gelatoporia subvermispora B]
MRAALYVKLTLTLLAFSTLVQCGPVAEVAVRTSSKGTLFAAHVHQSIGDTDAEGPADG